MKFFPHIPYWTLVVKIKSLTEKTCDLSIVSQAWQPRFVIPAQPVYIW